MLLSSGGAELACGVRAREPPSRSGEQELTGPEGSAQLPPRCALCRHEVESRLPAGCRPFSRPRPADPPKGPRPTYRPMTAEVSVHRKVTQQAWGRAATAPESPAGASPSWPRQPQSIAPPARAGIPASGSPGLYREGGGRGASLEPAPSATSWLQRSLAACPRLHCFAGPQFPPL